MAVVLFAEYPVTIPIRLDATDDSLSSEPTDTLRLIERVRAGEVAAFEALYRQYWTRLYNFAFRYLRSTEDAEEVVQEVFFRIWRRRESWRVAGKLDNYLYFAVRNAAFDRLQHFAVVAQWEQRVRLDAHIAQRNAVASAEAALHAGDFGAAVERALSELPPKRRAICMLRWVDGLTYTEIAARLDIAEKTVETQIGRGLRYLRERLRELHG